MLGVEELERRDVPSVSVEFNVMTAIKLASLKSNLAKSGKTNESRSSSVVRVKDYSTTPFNNCYATFEC
jgi:hypothetical protein